MGVAIFNSVVSVGPLRRWDLNKFLNSFKGVSHVELAKQKFLRQREHIYHKVEASLACSGVARRSLWVG